MRDVAAIIALLFCVLPCPSVTQEQSPRITRIEFRPATAEEGGGMLISLLGTGQCSYTIEYGDGKSEDRTAQLPDRIQHTYPGDGDYQVVAKPQPPCVGVARATITIRAISRGVWGISGELGPGTDTLEFIVRINGQGQCSVTLDLGDGNSQKFEATLPTTRTHKYGSTGTYQLRATTVEPCRGEAEMKVEIKRH